MSSIQQLPVENYLVDGVHSVSIHNGVVRIVFMRLDSEGNALPSVELNIPMSQIDSISDVMSQIK